MKYLLGIDFGTTTTAISCTRISATFEPELIEIDNQRTTESVVRLTDGNEIEIIGLKAWEEIGDAPERTFYEFKLKVGSKDLLRLPEGPGTARDIGVLFLRNLREKIERGLFGNSSLNAIDSKEGVKTVIGYPSGWSEVQRKATLSMAEDAGFPNVEGCEEPIGALYYHYHLGDLSLNEAQKILVYDFGGGTSDVAIIETNGAPQPKVIATSGIGDLGGRSFDERIAFAWEQKLLSEMGKLEITNRDRSWLRRHSRRLKERLSIAVEGNGNSANETIPILQCKGGRDSFSLDLASFESMNVDLISRFDEPLWDAMSSASLNPSDIDIVILTGGSGRFYFARNKLKKLFPKARFLRSANPQETVSKGLALYSKLLADNRKDGRKKTDHATLERKVKKISGKTVETPFSEVSSPCESSATALKKKFDKKVVYLGGFVVAVVLLWILFSGGSRENGFSTSATDSVQTSVPTLKDKSVSILKNVETLYKSLAFAQKELNVSMIGAIQRDVDNIDVSDVVSEVAMAKSALSAWANVALDFHRKHGQHPNSAKKIWPMPTSIEVDALKDQGFLEEMSSIAAFSIDSAENCFLYYLDKSYLALGEKAQYRPVKYSIRLESFSIDGAKLKKETKYDDGVGKYLKNPIGGILIPVVMQPVNLAGLVGVMVDEGDPDVKVVVAIRDKSLFIPIKMYPEDKDAYEDALRGVISDSFTWYVKEGQSLYLFMLDIDQTHGELLAYNEIPSAGFSGWFDLGAGCGINLRVSTEKIK